MRTFEKPMIQKIIVSIISQNLFRHRKYNNGHKMNVSYVKCDADSVYDFSLPPKSSQTLKNEGFFVSVDNVANAKIVIFGAFFQVFRIF